MYLAIDRRYGSAAARIAAETAVAVGDIAIDGDTGNIFRRISGGWNQVSAAGAAHVTTAPGGLTRIRQEAALGATAVTLDFGSPGISALKLSAASEAAGTAELAATVAFCIDPPSDAYRDSALTAGDALAVDSQLLILHADKENDTITFTSPVRYIGAKRLWGSQALTLVGVGVEV